MIRTATPRTAASRSAPATTSFVSGPRLKSYCARSSDRCALPRNSATARAISSGCWPPSVRVRIRMEELISRLADATIGDTFNFYRDGDGAEIRRSRLLAYLRTKENAPLLLVGEAAGYRGARVSGIPFTSERQLTGRGPAEASATIVHRVLAAFYEDVERKTWRGRAPLVPRRRGGQDARASRDADRGHAARQRQARVHAARRHRRLRRGRERREDRRHGKEARRQDVLPPLGLSRRPP